MSGAGKLHTGEQPRSQNPINLPNQIPLYGNLEPYDPSSTITVRKWIYLFERFCDLNHVPLEAVQPERTILINYIGKRVVDFLIDHYDPRDPREVPIQEIRERLEEIFEPQAAVSAYRSQFYNRIQKSNESIAYFCTALQQLARKSNWGQHANQALRDRLQSGVFNQTLKRKLKGMADTTTFGQMRTFALREEALDEQLAQQARMIPPIHQVEAETITYVSTNLIRGTGSQDNHRNNNATVAVETSFTPRFSNPTWRPNFNANWRRNWPSNERRGFFQARPTAPGTTGFRQQNPSQSARQQSPSPTHQKRCWRCGSFCSNSHTPQTCRARN